MKTNKTLINILKLCIVILIVSLLTQIIVRAGVLTPSASPAATSYTLTDIYTRLTTNATATEANHVFTPSASPVASFYTLTQIYDVVPTIVANTVKLGTSYLGIAGSLTPEGAGTAAVADLFNAKTANLTNDWTLDTGTLDLACNDPTFNGTLNKVATAYDGLGDGTNRWCMTNTGDAVAGEMLSGKKAWVDGVEITGSLATQTLSAANDTVAAGNYAATTLSSVDADLTSANILSTKTIFGIAGNSNVVNTSTGTAIAGDLFNSKIAWVDGSSVAGTLDLACNDPALFNGTDNKVATAYDGLGDGTNRWCMSDSGNVAVGEMKTGQVAWVDGVAITGTGTQTLSAANSTVNAGYYAATTLETVDTDLAAGNINSGTVIFGVTGTLFVPSLHTGQTTSFGTADDDADNDGTAKSYTDNANDTVTDNHTGLIWQKYDQAAKNWEDAMSYCNGLTLGGSSDWRLPSVLEGLTMLDWECSGAGGSCYNVYKNSALDWTSTGSGGYLWTSTSRIDVTIHANGLSTGVGANFTADKTSTYPVRCVR
ncbi:MAG: DUF1566 domain-containing protein [bacterium]